MTDETCGCGCCVGVAASTPRPVEQRHGLDRIGYRVGTHADFFASLVAALTDDDLPALAKLRSRDPRDFTVALLDGAATLCDVLTFYTERLVQESYLGTAQDRTSLQELGKLVAYRLRPGVAATTYLAFFVQPPPSTPAPTGAPDEAFAAGPYLPGGVELPAGLPVRSVPGPGEQPQTFETSEAILADPRWNALRAWPTRQTVLGSGEGGHRAYLTGTGHRLKSGECLLFRGATGWDIRTVTGATEQAESNRTLLTWAPGVENSDLGSDAKLYVFRKTPSPFGANSPHMSLIKSGSADWPFDIGPDKAVDLDGSHPDILVGSYLVLERGSTNTLAEVKSIRELSRSDYAISGRITRVGTDVNLDGYNSELRNTVVYAVSQELPVAQEPDDSPLTGGYVIVPGDIDLPVNRVLLVAGTGADGQPTSELVTHLGSWRTPTATLIAFTGALVHSYRRDSVVIYGNVAAATHGETFHEILGNGNGSEAHQRFRLKQGPLTYVPSSDPVGASSTLQVRVNDIVWHEVSTLYEAGPGDRRYVTQVDAKGDVVTLFGDGERGARLPNGQHNVHAVYRKGTGTGGNVPAGAISQVMDPPLGLTKVTNPQPAIGGADPEPVGTARRGIPLPVRTLGRAVSLLDYADYARAFAGIDKADATVLNLAGGRTIVVTVAGAGGAAVPPDTRDRLVTSMRTYGDPTVSVLVLPFRLASFRLALRYKRHPDHLADTVSAAIRTTLAEAFAFDARDFGQPVHRSEVLTAVHRVPGVVAVDLDKLYRTAAPIPPEPGWPATPASRLSGRLLAARPRATADGAPLAVELLTAAAGDPFDSLVELA
jgi:hypothetical protein